MPKAKPKINPMDDETNRQTLARRLWEREGGVCLSYMVSTLAVGYGERCPTRDLNDLCEQAFELASPIPDYEEAALQAGWKENPRGDGFDNTETGDNSTADDWEELCSAEGIETDDYQREVYEHWSVSNWLAEKLSEQGEKVDDDFGGLNVWARTCTGQSIVLDGVMQRIALNTFRPTSE